LYKEINNIGENMKNILLIIAVLLMPILVSAQDDEIDNLPFENEPLREESLSYFLVAGGLTFDWLMLNEDHLNSFIANVPEGLKLSGPMQLSGGQGVTGIPWIKNLRIGVLGYGGSLESDIVTENDIDYQAKLTASMFGFSVHYGYVPFRGFAILGGVNAGWGDVRYETYATVKDALSEFDMHNGGTNRLQKDYFFVMPNIQLEYALANFIVLRADASYNLTVGQDENWTYNANGTNTVNPDFNLNGLKVGFGVMVGLINF
jgi:hypothetical protein